MNVNDINNQDARLKKAFNFLSTVNINAYKDIFLLSNQVLSKNTETNTFLKRFLNLEKVESSSHFFILKQLLKYYFYSFKIFISYLFEKFEFYLSIFRFRDSGKNKKELILIDIFFIINKIIEDNSHKDIYFPGLQELLKKLNKNYAYLPEFDGIKKRLTMYKIFKILKKESLPILSEYQLLSIFDLLHIFYFILIYPFRVIKLINTLDKNNYEEGLLISELINTLEQVTFLSFSRYLQGRRIVKLPYKKIKVISWYENQTTHKNLFKGLRTNNDKIKIYGTQLFLYPQTMLNIIPDENEISFGIMPDKILVNGPKFMPEKSRINFSIGPSLRYSKIFNTIPKIKNKKIILVLLPYYKNYSKIILKMVSEIDLFNESIFVKAHPSLNINEFNYLLRSDLKLVKEDTYNLFEKTKILISAATGATVEAATLGIPVIYVKNTDNLDYNFLPEFGKGIIWDEIENAIELKNKIDEIEHILKNKSDEIKKISDSYKKTFFNEPKEENIIECFELKDN